jgi:hypothetical protein
MNARKPIRHWFFLILFSFGLSLIANSQTTFNKGDAVEASYAGDWVRAVIIGGAAYNGFDTTYEVQFDGSTYSSRIAAKWVRPLFRANVSQRFKVGDRVAFRRWDNAVYEGEVIGVDDKKYEIRYTRDGSITKEWITEIAVRPGTAGTTAAVIDSPKPAEPAPNNPLAKAWAGQKFAVGDRVMYDQLGFLTTKSFGTVVSVDPNTRLYTVRDEKDPSVKYSYACYQVLSPTEKIDNSFFVGKWDVYVSGALYTTVEKDKVFDNISGGMKLAPLEIKANGTYKWVTEDKKVITGLWKARNGVPGITLLKGIDGLDWTLYENTEEQATTKSTRDEIRFHHIPSQTGYYMAYRIGPNRSCVLAGRSFKN